MIPGRIACFLILGLLLWAPTLTASSEAAEANNQRLLMAAEAGRLDLVLEMLNRDVRIDARDTRPEGNTALMLAAKRGHRDIVALLLSRGADINARASDNWTALMQAAHDGYLSVVKLLLDHGADIGARETRYGNTALILAAGPKSENMRYV